MEDKNGRYPIARIKTESDDYNLMIEKKKAYDFKRMVIDMK